MTRHRLEQALLPEGWGHGVEVEIDDRGRLTEVRPKSSSASESAGAFKSSDATEPSASVQPVPGMVLPGFVNLHSHAFQRGLAGRTEHTTANRTASEAPDTFWSWREAMYAFLAHLDPDAVEVIAAQLYTEMLEAGYTSVVEFHYLHRDPEGAPYDDPSEMAKRLIRAAERTGIRMTLVPVVYMQGGFAGEPLTHGQRRFRLDGTGLLDLLADLMPHRSERIEFGAGIHSLRAAPLEEIAEIVTTIRSRYPGLPLHMHVSEQMAEVESCRQHTGQRPVEWGLEHLPIDDRWCLIHCTHLTATEVEALARSRAVVGLCPTTEANLGDGFFPLRAFVRAGGRFGIGSDSHVSVSPVEELRWLEYGQRLVHRERNVLSGATGESMSTGRALVDAVGAGGSDASGRNVGVLARDHSADWIVLDPDHPILTGLEGDSLLDGWIFSGNRSCVTDVCVGGEWVVREGRHRDYDAVVEEFRRVSGMRRS